MPYGCARMKIRPILGKIMRDRYIYKVLTLGQWTDFQQNGAFKGSPVDLQDGYIHLSCVPELVETMDKYYADQPEVALLQVDANAVSDDLKYEASRGGIEFPHLFADLLMGAIGKVWLLSPREGRYTLPDDIER